MGSIVADATYVELKDKVQQALDEGRMLILAVQVLLGFGFQAPLMRAFADLPTSARVSKLVSLGLLLATTLLVLATVARHRIVERGQDTQRLHAFVRNATTLALLPFAFALALDGYVVGCRVYGTTSAALAAGLACVVTLIVWYVAPWAERRPPTSPIPEGPMEETSLQDKIRQVLTEARVVLPGTQALLGFQFAAVLQERFADLPQGSKALHFVGLAFLAASVVLLMLPTAFHRIAEHGEISDRLHRVSSVALLGAMATLSAGLACDVFVVVRMITDSEVAATCASITWLLASFAIWFVWMGVLRVKYRRREAQEYPDARHA